MFVYIFKIVFVLVSVGNIFSADKTCNVSFYKLADAVNNVFDRAGSKVVMDLSFDIESKELKTNKGHVIKFLKDKILEKFTNAEIKIYFFIGFDNDFDTFRELPHSSHQKHQIL